MKLTLIAILSFLFFSCGETKSNTNKKMTIDEKEFLNHEILNDSIHYRIKEYDKKNCIYRNICVFNKDELLEESLIYKTQKKDLMDEGYFVKKKKIYEMNEQNSLTLFEINSHYHDYILESEDTIVSLLVVTADGKIKIEKVPF